MSDDLNNNEVERRLEANILSSICSLPLSDCITFNWTSRCSLCFDSNSEQTNWNEHLPMWRWDGGDWWGHNGVTTLWQISIIGQKYKHFTLNSCFDVPGLSVLWSEKSIVGRADQLSQVQLTRSIIYKNAFLFIFSWKKQFSWNFYNLVLMLLVRV